jgi:hypothetical protein
MAKRTLESSSVPSTPAGRVGIAESAIQQRLAQEAAVDELVARLADGHNATADEMQFVELVGIDRNALRRRVAQRAYITTLQARAGNAEDRSNAIEAVAAAKATLDERRPALEQTITAAQAELAELDQAVSAAERLVADQKQAVETLRQKLPARIGRAIGELQTRYGERIARPAKVAQRTIDLHRTMSVADASTAEGLEHIKRYCQGRGEKFVGTVFPHRPTYTPRPAAEQEPHAVLYRVSAAAPARLPASDTHGPLDKQAWQEHVEELRVAAEEAQVELERLEQSAEAHALQAEIARLSDYWLT